MTFRTYKKIIWLFVLCIFLLSCSSSAEVLKQDIIEFIDKNDFSILENLSKGQIKKIAKLQDGSFYYISLRLSESDYKNKDELLQKFLSYGIKYYKKPFNTLCENLFLEVVNVEEKILFLENKKLAQSELSKKKKVLSENDILQNEKITFELDSLYLQVGNFDKMSEPLESFLRKNNLSQNQLFTLQSHFFDQTSSEQLEKEKTTNTFYGINFACLLYEQGYHKKSASLVLRILQDTLNDKSSDAITKICTRPVISSFGKALLTITEKSSIEKALNLLSSFYAQTLDLLVEPLSKDELSALHAVCFYIARLYEKFDYHFLNDAIKYYELASQYAQNDLDFDNAIWYALKSLYSDEKAFLTKLSKTVPKWKNAYWYEDLIAKLTSKYVQQGNVLALQKLLSIISPTSLNEEKAKLHYIIARLTNSQLDMQKAYSLKQNNYYYKLMSSYHLKTKSFFSIKKKYKRETDFTPEESYQIIEGLKTFKLYSLIYPHLKKYAKNISVDDAKKIAKVLYENAFYADSINLIQYACNSQGAVLDTECIQLLYPRPFSDVITQYATEYKMPEYFIYALIRCESFFKTQVTSHAGAVGLCQLMPSTARGIAKHFKLDSYDILDPQTNIRFGVFYLSRMIRSQNNYAKAFAAYNAGAGNVKKWINRYQIQLQDIFTEATPFPETRNYTKKILQTACIYAELYYNIPFEKVISDFYGF